MLKRITWISLKFWLCNMNSLCVIEQHGDVAKGWLLLASSNQKEASPTVTHSPIQLSYWEEVLEK